MDLSDYQTQVINPTVHNIIEMRIIWSANNYKNKQTTQNYCLVDWCKDATGKIDFPSSPLRSFYALLRA